MARWRQRLVAGLLLAVVTGCEIAGGYSLVEPGRHQFDDEFSVSSKLAWSQLAFGERHVWTINGAGLEAVWFYAGIEDGDALLTNVGQEEDAPRFDSDMHPNEVMELVVDSLGLIGSVKVEGTGLRPAAFGSAKGFRFELALQSQEGLIKRGLAAGAVQDGKLQLIVYLAAELYYYDKYLDEVEGIVASVQLT